MQEQKEKIKKSYKSATSDIVARINEAENILIALSKNPTADELAAAIGLSLYLDKAGKHATAIYSGETPNILEFLEPERRLETNTDSLQDFIIAINKDKADHLRYKVEGDYVRVYITPYKTKISAEDLEFSHGDFNIGLVVALNVPSEESLDAALTNHGRILHDAEIINIAATASGNFGQTQWLDPTFSSVSEMIANLVFDMETELGNDLDKETATALLTGIFVATDRFSNGRTQPETMNMAARLMSAGADQQQISAHLTFEDGNVDAVEHSVPKENEREDLIKNDFVIENYGSENALDNQKEQVKSEEIDESRIGLDLSGDSVSEPAINDMQIVTESGSGLDLNAEKDVLPLDAQDIAVEEYGAFEEKVNTENDKMITSEPEEIPTTGFELPLVPNDSEVVSSEKATLDQIETPFEETPVPDYMNPVTNPVSVSIQQPVVQNSQEVPLASSAMQSSISNSEGAQAPEVNLANAENQATDSIPNAEPSTGILGKDYGAMMDEMLKADEQQAQQSQEPQQSQQPQHGFLGGNPALMAAPGVSDAPEENNIPGIDFSNPVGIADDEQPAGAPQNNIGALGRDYPIDAQPLAPSQAAENAPHLAPLPHSDSVSFVPESNNPMQETVSAPAQPMTPEPMSTGMPLPGEEILPPPPTPPVDFGSVQAAQPVGEPVLPLVDANIFNSSVVVQPDSLVNQQPQVQPIPQPTPQPQSMSPVNNDPSAFRIPGM